MPASPVDVRRETVVLPTYEPHLPDRNPMFLEKRVYQGSSGRVYPLPFVDRIGERPRPHEWDAVFVENDFIRVMILPELGGRIHRLQDKTNGYEAIYHQPVIKPALVGLAGPWCSGGIEFNWPQHHRPSTFMPVDVAIEKHADGAVTVWLSEHDPMARMKGMHGVRLHPEKSCLELVARVYNRTPHTQTFLWWANVATRVHEQYQSFFPPDVTQVADHAKRALSAFPLCRDRYYGVNYAARGREGIPAAEVPRCYVPPHCRPAPGDGTGGADVENYSPADLSWYANIPVPTSYMCVGSDGDFFGGFDHRARAGIIHVANHHLAPGKKQWTWGNHEFGYAWDRNLTDRDPATGEFPPYIELMAGVFTDNQPDFSFLGPGETKTWSQFWYPIREIGPACAANAGAALSFTVQQGRARIGLFTTSVQKDVTLSLEAGGQTVGEWKHSLTPAEPLVIETPVNPNAQTGGFRVRATTADGGELISWLPPKPKPATSLQPATEPPAPADVRSTDELFVIGLHLEQYRHATRLPEAYWREALRRDEGDARCNLALGRWHLRRGELALAETHLRRSIERLTSRNPNPSDGEAHYQLGLCLRHQAFLFDPNQKSKIEHRKLTDAYAAFYKATWNHACQPAAYHALAEIDCVRHDWSNALRHVERALRNNPDNLRARNLKALILRRLGRDGEASALLDETLALDPLDWWARHLGGEQMSCDAQILLDLALDYAQAGFFTEALTALENAAPRGQKPSSPRSSPASLGTAPLVHYYRAWLYQAVGDKKTGRASLTTAAKTARDFCFPARLEEIAILEYAMTANPRDARAPYFLGNLLYDRRRQREAISLWERAVKLEPSNAIAWRNLGIAYFNVEGAPLKARRAYERAFHANRRDARLLYERDQLWKRLGEPPAKRLRELLRHPDLVRTRDDLSVELCALFNLTGQAERALGILQSRKFQPWEGGEGQALGQHVRTHLALGRQALNQRRPTDAVAHFRAALDAPENLGEAKHLLSNQSDIHFWLGCAHSAAGDEDRARTHWTAAAEFKGDFQGMSVRTFSEMTFYSALALRQLKRAAEAGKLLRALLAHARTLAKAPAKIDYFATSLPTMLLFDDDLALRQKTTARFLEAQARLGLGQQAAARKLLREVLRRDPSHALAMELSKPGALSTQP